MKRVSWLVVLAFFAFACELGDEIVVPVDPQAEGFDKVNRNAAMQNIQICCDAEVFTLWGGKHTNVGTVTVANNEDNLFVTYTTTGDWWLEEVHLYVLTQEPLTKLTPGHAPYKMEFNPLVKTYTFTVPLADYDVTCDETVLWIQAHAAVAKIVEGEKEQGETAYGGEVKDSHGSWYGNIGYKIHCCSEEPTVCKEFKGETAWSEGNRYVTRGNWATYTPYIECRVDIYAGQNIYVGYIDFSAVVNNKVTITITLIGDWVLEDVKEAVKIQGYNVAPTGNPAPGRFTTYKGNALTITVDAYKFYGIHLDVGQWVEVECKI
jgi:hypothetical protein